VQRFPDVQKLLVEDLTAYLIAAELTDAGHAGIETPPDLADQLPFIRVLRVGGPSTRVNDHAVVDVDIFAATYATGWDLAEDVRQHLCGPPPPVGAFDRIVCDIAPRELVWGDSDDGIRRFNATYTITSRRRPT